MKKYKYNINNLECASCAKRIEQGLNNNSKLNSVVVNFATSKISYESENEISLKEINQLVKQIEFDAVVTENNKAKQTKEYQISVLVIGVFFGIFGMYLELPSVFNETFILISYIILLYRPFINASRMLIKNKTINENALILISCIGAYLVNQVMEGIMVIFLYLLGKILEEKALNNTRKSIVNLINIKQDYANKKLDKEMVKINVEDILIDDILVVKKGERVPVDGVIIKGVTKLDTSALTGESEPITVEKSSTILSGSINVNEVIEMKVTSLFKDSTVSRILSLLEEATEKKAKTETFVARASKIYTPVVLLLASLVAILLPLFTDISYSESIYRGLTFLVISCPCAIAISVPLSYFTGIGVSSKNGILIKGSNYLDNLCHANKIIFDKTGTLTTGTFEVKDIKIFDKSYTKDEVIDTLVKGESLSNHPIAKSIMKLTDEKASNKDIKNYKEIEGQGISFELENKKVMIGNAKICKCTKDADIHLNIDGKHIASITISDGIKTSAYESIKALKLLNIKTYMFTGDKEDIAKEIGKRLDIDEVKYEMLPTDKYHEYEIISKVKDEVIFVGDGINDAPVLKRANTGISMGGIGSSSAIESSDIVIMNDDLNKIPKAINIAKYTNYVIKQNLIVAIAIKLIILFLSIIGVATMWSAVFADTGVTVLTILNTLRIMKKY